MVASKSLVVDTLCRLYALGLVVLGLLIPITNSLASKDKQIWTTTFQELFYVVENSVSLAFFVFVYLYLVRGVSRFDSPSTREWDELHKQSKENSLSLETIATVVSLDTRTIEAVTDKEQQNGVQYQQNGDTVSSPAKVCQLGGNSQLPPATNLKHGDASYPNFYVRVGAVLFGVGTLIADGIQLASYVETWVVCPGVPVSYSKLLQWTTQILFVCLQLYFIFKYSKISINRWKVLCRFGVMHLLATNINEWIHAVVEEITEATEEEHHTGSLTNYTRSATGLMNDTTHCARNTPTGAMFRTSRQYLFPMLIEFSLIGAVCLYNIYENIGMQERIRRTTGMRRRSQLSSAPGHLPPKVSACHKSYKGLFFGVIMMAVATISIIMFNVYKGDTEEIADAIFGLSVMGAIIPSSLAVSFALYQLQKLEILPSYKRGPDETLLMITAVGLYAHDVTTLTDIIFAETTLSMIFVSCNCAISIIQSGIQVIFITDGLRRRTTTPHILRYKPGREAVVFLLLLNLALWAMNTFMARSVKPQSWITSQAAWIIIHKIFTPLAIFFRFHSTTCLYEIWNTTYKWHKSDD
ncbi:proton channel OtopLc-like [Lineus longissimus]|uniref:proton channel OtopLc-like n=1 Tax=Lineus longissimus TaxID=88925 RepID=UPI00315C6C47